MGLVLSVRAGCAPGLGEMYVADRRFACSYENVANGFAAYMRNAIRANAAGP